uniref:C2 domain-containing protein n=1 Tax=Brassica oleracea var. oleracea TaxID=109376 RepID=A0A0D3B644_BRAOL
MGETFIEICLISARGLRIGPGFGCSLLKHQLHAVGWIDPKNKFCTTVSASRSDNPHWRTRVITSLDDDDNSMIHALYAEVYSRKPIFLTKKFHGSVFVPLKEFFTKYKNQKSSSGSVFEETISCQLTKENSSKPQGSVNVSIRIAAERQDFEGSAGQNDMAGSSQQTFATLNQPNSSNSFSLPPDNHYFPMPNPNATTLLSSSTSAAT